MSNYGVFEYPGRIDRALYVKINTPIWCEFGRPTTPWPLGPATPPATGMVEIPTTPLPNQIDVDTPYLYVRANLLSVMVPITQTQYTALAASNPGSVIIIGGLWYQFVTDVNAFTAGAYWLYAEFIVDVATGMPPGQFRQTRVFSGLVPTAGNEGAAWLVPANVSQKGLAQRYDTNSLVVTDSSQAWTSQILIAL